MNVKQIFSLLKSSVNDFLEDDCSTQAAALSYYTIFSLPPLLMIILLIVGMLVNPEDIRGQLESQLGSAATNVESYLSTQCGIDTEGTGSASPTS